MFLTTDQAPMHRPGWRARKTCWILWLGAVLIGARAWAGLGEPHASVASQPSQIHSGSQRTILTPSYAISELVLMDGTKLREYSSRDGIVFAVMWSGPAHPDLKVLLGPHYWRYLAEARRLQPEPKLLSIDTRELVVQVLKLPRGVAGVAYLPALIPAGTAREVFR